MSTAAPGFVIQAAYRACIKEYHPDHYRGADASQRTADVIEAFRVLSDPMARRSLDEYLAAGSLAQHRAATSPRPPPQPPGNSRPNNRAPPQARAAAQKLGGVAWILAGLPLAAITVGLFAAWATDTILWRNPAADTIDPRAAKPMPASLEPTAAPDPSASPMVPALRGELSLPADPIDLSVVESAASTFLLVLRRSGIDGAQAFSEKCHKNEAANPTWRGLDFCAAFDFAASNMDGGLTAIGSPRNAYFEFQRNHQEEHYGRYRLAAHERIQKIRPAAYATLLRAYQSQRVQVPISTRTGGRALDSGTSKPFGQDVTAHVPGPGVTVGGPSEAPADASDGMSERH